MAVRNIIATTMTTTVASTTFVPIPTATATTTSEAAAQTLLAPGCYLKQSEASPKECGGPFLEWERDFWGEANANSGASEASCLARKARHDAYCEVSTEWLFVDTLSEVTPASLAPGCYLKQSEVSPKDCGGPFLEWERDVWGEANADSGASEESCLGRKANHDAYCEVDTTWLFVDMLPTRT